MMGWETLLYLLKVIPEGKGYLERDDEMPLWGEPFGIGMDEGLERERNNGGVKLSSNTGSAADLQSPTGTKWHIRLEKFMLVRELSTLAFAVGSRSARI